jgi:hypothetical protein
VGWFKGKLLLTMDLERNNFGVMPRQARLDAPGTLHHVELQWRLNPVGKVRKNLPSFKELAYEYFTQKA